MNTETIDTLASLIIVSLKKEASIRASAEKEKEGRDKSLHLLSRAKKANENLNKMIDSVLVGDCTPEGYRKTVTEVRETATGLKMVRVPEEFRPHLNEAAEALLTRLANLPPAPEGGCW